MGIGLVATGLIFFTVLSYFAVFHIAEGRLLVATTDITVAAAQLVAVALTIRYYQTMSPVVARSINRSPWSRI